jgi:hypothetical protein
MRVGDVCAEAVRENAVKRSARASGAYALGERIAAAGIVRRMAACSCGGGTGIGKPRTEYTLWRTHGHVEDKILKGASGREPTTASDGRQARV